MADLEISSLPAVTVPLPADAFAMVNDGITKQVTRAQVHTLQLGELLVLPNGDDPSIPEIQFPNSGIYEDLNDELAFSQGGAKVGHLTSSAAGGMFIDNTLTGAGLERVLTTSDAASFGEYRGTFDAGIGTFPVTSNQGDWFNCTVAGTVDGQAFVIGDILVALIDSPSTVTFAANWSIVPHIGVADHLLLTNIGTNTHAQIDTHIADATIHFTEASIDHANILNIGVNTHAQIDAHIASAAASAGAAGTVVYEFDNNTGGTDPGATFFRTSTGNPASVTQFRFSDLDVGSLDVQNVLGNMVAGSYFIMRNAADNTQFRVYAITSIVDNAGWYVFNVNYLNAQSSGDAAIVNGADIMFEFFVTAMAAPTAQTGNMKPFAVWDGSDTRYEGSGTLISTNPSSPPLGGRLQLGTTSGYSTASPQIMRPLGAADTVMDFVYGTDPNNGFLQGYRRVAGEMNFGARIASTDTDMLTLDLLANVRIETAASFKIEQRGAAAADLAGHGQLWVNSADDSLNYQTEAGANTVLNVAAASPTQLIDGGANVAVIAEGSGIIGVRSVGNTDAEDRRLTWEYQDGTIRSSIGQEFFTDVIYRNHIAGRHQIFNCGTGGSSRIRLHLDGTSATGGVSLYAGTSATARLATANEGVRIQNGTLFLAEQAAQEVDDVGFGQLFVDSADDALHYITEAGVDFNLTAGSGITATATPAVGEVALWDSTGATLAGNPDMQFAAGRLTIGDAGVGGVILDLRDGNTTGSGAVPAMQFTDQVGTVMGTLGQSIIVDHMLLSSPTGGLSLSAGQVLAFNAGTDLRYNTGLLTRYSDPSDTGVDFADVQAVEPGLFPYLDFSLTGTFEEFRFNGDVNLVTADLFLGTNRLAFYARGDSVDNHIENNGGELEILCVADALRVTADSIKLSEQSGPAVNTVAYGQFWVETAVPNVPKFTNDADVDGTLVRAEFAQTFTAIQTFNDDINLVFGTGSDTEMHWDNISARFEINVPAGGDLAIRAGTETMLTCNGDGGVSMYWDNNQVTLTNPTTNTGITSGLSVKDHGNNFRHVGFNDIAIFNDNVSDTLEASHAGSMAFKDATTARTLTLASNVDLDFPAEHMTTIVNAFTSGDYTITEGASTTLYYLDGTTRVDTAGGCTVGPGGVANIWRESATVYYIWGTGITP